MSKPSYASSATSTIPQSDEFRIPRPVVMAGIELPELEMWRWWLRIKKFDMKTPLDHGLRLLAVLDIGKFVRRFGFRFTVFGERPEPLRYILVTQSKWFHEGYLGMPEEEIPFYPGPGKCEERARVFLQKCKIRGAAELPYRTLLVGEDPSLY
ncbi:hypothetical protein K466DRAFT_569373 [Polyporus arcularius HHB13444]|uniref:Uncharacterized protein n=1 Tax=Polyporus arcularius HHB13444 TaxID=1314778 RepID=A0A5C3NTR7_9APHY|nr:hypothetical protein K466DRAFT_569373 [Polyporus arcularius HHB13444]